jgi:hypothetical protein
MYDIILGSEVKSGDYGFLRPGVSSSLNIGKLRENLDFSRDRIGMGPSGSLIAACYPLSQSEQNRSLTPIHS